MIAPHSPKTLEKLAILRRQEGVLTGKEGIEQYEDLDPGHDGKARGARVHQDRQSPGQDRAAFRREVIRVGCEQGEGEGRRTHR